MKNLIITAILSLVLISCGKDDPIPPVDSEPIPENNIPIYVPGRKGTYYFGYGNGNGYKNGNKFAFTAATEESPLNSGIYAIFICTYAKDSLSLREVMGARLPDLIGRNDDFRASYIVVYGDGDVFGNDNYTLDTTKPHWIEIKEMDKDKNIIKGTMEAHFNLDDTINKDSPNNPNHVKFTKLNFETKFKK